MMALAVALAGDIVPKERTGRAMGLLGTVSAAGAALGPSLGGVLVTSLGWPAVFAVMALAGAATLLAAQRTLPADQRAQASPTSFDVAGVALLALSLAGYALATTLEVAPPIRVVIVALSVAGLAAFVAVEANVSSPLIELQRLRDRELSSSLASIGLVSTVVMATLVVGPFYLSGALGLSPMATGLVMSVGPAAGGEPGLRLTFTAAAVLSGLALAATGSGSRRRARA